MDKCNFTRKWLLIITRIPEGYAINETKSFTGVKNQNSHPISQTNYLLIALLYFFNDKILKIRNTLMVKLPSVHLLTHAPVFSAFSPVTENEISKIISNSPTKSCLLHPWPITPLAHFSFSVLDPLLFSLYTQLL